MTRPTYLATCVAEGPRVLCPELYRRLREVFGDVAIANQGEAMVARASRRAGRPWLDVSHAGEYYRVNCFACHDTRKRLWINHMYGQPSVDSRRLSFLAVCYNEDCLSQPENRRALEDMIFGFRNARDRRPVFQVAPGEQILAGPLVPQEWPGRCIPAAELPDTHPMIVYFAIDRGIPRETLVEYDVRYCAEPPPDSRLQLTAGRAIIPVVMDGVMVGWQARYIGEVPGKYPPKYFTMPGMPKRRLLYNLDRARHCPFPVLVEGATDVWRVGQPGVAMFGKTLSTMQRQRLSETWPDRPIVILLDSDATQAAYALADEWQAMRVTSPVVVAELPPGYDPGDLPTAAIWKIIYAAAAKANVVL